jgi:hypothetical protein
MRTGLIRLNLWMAPLLGRQILLLGAALFGLHLLDRSGWLAEEFYWLLVVALSSLPTSLILSFLAKNAKWWIQLPTSRLTVFFTILVSTSLAVGLVPTFDYLAFRLHQVARPPSPEFLHLMAMDISQFYFLIGIAFAVPFVLIASFRIFSNAVLGPSFWKGGLTGGPASHRSNKKSLIESLVLMGGLSFTFNELDLSLLMSALFLAASLGFVKLIAMTPQLFFNQRFSILQLRAVFGFACLAPTILVGGAGITGRILDSPEGRIEAALQFGKLAPQPTLADFKVHLHNQQNDQEKIARFFEDYCRLIMKPCLTELGYPKPNQISDGLGGLSTAWLLKEVNAPKVINHWLRTTVDLSTVPIEDLKTAFHIMRNLNLALLPPSLQLRLFGNEQELFKLLDAADDHHANIVLGLRLLQLQSNPSPALQQLVAKKLDLWTRKLSSYGLDTLVTTVSLMEQQRVDLREIILRAEGVEPRAGRSPSSQLRPKIQREDCKKLSDQQFKGLGDEVTLNFCLRQTFLARKDDIRLDRALREGWVTQASLPRILEHRTRSSY